MPIYSYKCLECENKEDRIVKWSNADEQVCKCKEGAKMEREDIIHAPSFQLKGTWFKTRGTY